MTRGLIFFGQYVGKYCYAITCNNWVVIGIIAVIESQAMFNDLNMVNGEWFRVYQITL